MDLTHSPRHTRRGFLRGDSAPKFYSVAVTVPSSEIASTDFRPPASAPPQTSALPGFPPPPPAPATIRKAPTDFDAAEDNSMLNAIEASLAAPGGNAFLSWLAEQLEGKTSEEYDPYVEFGDQGIFAWGDGDEDPEATQGCEFESAYVDAAEDFAWCAPPAHRLRLEPRVEISPDGWRLELFPAGSKVVKDVLGKVVEVHSQFGECLYFRYGVQGQIESFERIHANGAPHSEGTRDRHGVVVRDTEGRVRAAGESMTVDPRGCFFLHTIDGQFFSVDLVTGIHTERRKVMDETGYYRFVTSLFAHDGFRMATMFTAQRQSTEYSAARASRFRFYGRDGTLIEFASDDDLQQLRPEKVSQPATRKLSRTFLNRRQATTAWDAVHEYLIRVS